MTVSDSRALRPLLCLSLAGWFAIDLSLVESVYAQGSMAEEVIARLEVSLAALQTVDSTIREYYQPISTVEGMEIDGSSGLVLLNDIHHKWDAATGRQAVIGKELVVSVGKVGYCPFAAAFDGARFRSYNAHPSNRSGVVTHYSGELTRFQWPRLLGIAIARLPTRSVVDILKSADSVSIEALDDGLLGLSCPFAMDNGDQMELRLRVDPEHGYLPSRIECRKLWSSTIDILVNVENFTRVGRLWFPTRGTVSHFYIERVLPAGHTKATIRMMRPEDRESVEKRITYVALPLSETNPRVVEVAAETLKVNTTIPDSAFSLDFPADVVIFDAFAPKP